MGFLYKQQMAIEAFRKKHKTDKSAEKPVAPKEKKLTPDQVRILKTRGAAMESALISHTV